VPVVARQTVEAWINEENGGPVLTAIARTSVVEAVARRVPMSANVRTFPRSGEADIDIIPKGSAYGEDISANDEVILTAKKFGRAARLAEEDIDDVNLVDLIADKKRQFFTAYARKLDNACLGAAGAVSATIPFTSVYQASRTADAGAGYTAEANFRFINRALTYDDLADVVGAGETGDFYDQATAIVIAHPRYRNILRKMKDGSGKYIFTEGNMSTDQSDQLFGMPVRWSMGAAVSVGGAITRVVAPTVNPAGAKGTAGNPLLIVAQPDALLLGVRSGPESVVIDGRSGLSALTDETILKMRARRAFGVAWPQAFQVLEYQPAA
jgi:HK97 family phage major capsid protein